MVLNNILRIFCCKLHLCQGISFGTFTWIVFKS